MRGLPRGATSALASLAALVLIASTCTAQVGTTGCADGLTGGCCAPAQLTLPPLPAIQFPQARETCWIDCPPQANKQGSLTVSAPVPAGPCGVFNATVGGSLMACPGGTLRLHYTRNWQQIQPGLGNVRVFRFVAVGSLCPGPLNPSCFIEPQAFYYGYVDYVFRCTPAAPPLFLAAAVALGHNCNAFVHDATCPFTADPLSNHPLVSNTIVAPGQNFTPNGSLTPPPFNITAPTDGLRRFVGTDCRNNEQWASASVVNGTTGCDCVSPTAGTQPFTRQALNGVTTCSSTVASSPTCPYNDPPTTHTFWAWSVGSWGAGPYPGTPNGAELWLVEGSANTDRAPNAVCAPIPLTREIFYGVETRVKTAPVSKPLRRFDIVNNMAPGAGQPMAGGPGIADKVVFLQ